MITKVMGRVTDTYWSVEENCHIDYESKKLIFDAKPEIKKNVVDCDSVVSAFLSFQDESPAVGSVF